MYVCMYVVCIYLFMYVHSLVRLLFVKLCSITSLNGKSSAYLFKFVCMYVCMYVCVCVCLCLYECIYLSILVCISSISRALFELTLFAKQNSKDRVRGKVRRERFSYSHSESLSNTPNCSLD